MQVSTRTGQTIPTTRPPQFGHKTHIVVDEPPFINRGVERSPNLRVGVPTDEENRINRKSTLSQAVFLGNLINKFF